MAILSAKWLRRIVSSSFSSSGVFWRAINRVLPVRRQIGAPMTASFISTRRRRQRKFSLARKRMRVSFAALAVAIFSGLAILAAINHAPSNAAPADYPTTITSISPDSGLTTGGMNAEITGTGFEYSDQFSQVSAGGSQTCALKTDGGVVCWGYNQYGQVGDGTTNNKRLVPTQVSGLTSGVQAIAAGGNHTCALKTDGSVVCWGLNNNGQIGDGTTGTNRPLPTQVSGLTSGVQAIVAGSFNTCALKTDGGVVCWGLNTYGQIGDGTSNNNRLVPTQVSDLTSGVQAIAIGDNHACALKTDSGVVCWGRNNYGQIGDGTSVANRLVPTQVSDLTSGVQAIAGGQYHTCAVKTDGSAVCWGRNDNGQIGDDTSDINRLVPTQVSGLTSGVQAITAGGWHSCALKTDNSAVCWGLNTYGQIGDGTSNNERLTPAEVSNLADGQMISTGSRYTCALKSDSNVVCWGHNSDGQIGDDTTTNRLVPTQIIASMNPAVQSVTFGGIPAEPFTVNSDSSISVVVPPHAAGGSVDVVITTLGGQTVTLTSGFTYVGSPTITSIAPDYGLQSGGTNVKITGTNFFYKQGVEVAQIVNGDGFSLALDTNGDIWAWGSNQYGQLGNTTNRGNRNPNPTPTKISVGVKFSQVVAGGYHSMALDTNGDIWAWGSNQYGQLGNTTNRGNSNPNPTPTKVITSVKFDQIAAGYDHSVAVDTNGDIWVWGNNQYGQLGFAANYAANPTPTKVITSAKFAQIGAGYYFCSALDTNGDIWTWGQNNIGQLGFTANNTANPTPTKVTASVKFSQISDGDYHSLALDTNGDIWAWGDNRYGELGNKTNSGNYNPNPTPTKVASDVKFSQVVGGFYYSFALDTNGDIWAWGDNRYGQLGTTIGSGAYTPNPTPTKVLASVKFERINADGARGASSFGIDTSGNVWAWGWNYYGQLGNTTNNNSATPNPTPTKIENSLPVPTIISPITSATLGGATCTDLVLLSSTSLTCTTSAHPSGLVDVVITNSDSQTATLPNGYTYIPPPTITNISPDDGETTGGTTVTITGTGLIYTEKILFDTTACTSLTIISDTQATCITPAHAAGTVNVTVSNILGQTATLIGGYTYHPPWYIDLALSKTDIKLYPGIDEVTDTDYLIANTDTNWPQGYILSIEQGPDGSTLECNTNPAFTLPTTTSDNTSTLGINSWGAGTGTSTNPPTNWHTISSTSTTLDTSTTPGSFDDYVYFGARVNYAQKPCTYEGAVVLTATMAI